MANLLTYRNSEIDKYGKFPEHILRIYYFLQLPSATGARKSRTITFNFHLILSKLPHVMYTLTE